MTTVRGVFMTELEQLVERRDNCVKTARAMRDREAALKQLLQAEELTEEIKAIEQALGRLPITEDEVTAPIRLSGGPG